jgi:hypothetical protein
MGRMFEEPGALRESQDCQSSGKWIVIQAREGHKERECHGTSVSSKGMHREPRSRVTSELSQMWVKLAERRALHHRYTPGLKKGE